MNPLRALSQWLPGLVRRLTGRGQTSAERAESEAKSSARKYWRRRVAEEQRRDDPAKGRPSREDAEAQKSARKYWEREVADEQERRGTPDPPGKR